MLPANTLDAIMLGERLVEKCVIGVKKFQDAAVFLVHSKTPKGERISDEAHDDQGNIQR